MRTLMLTLAGATIALGGCAMDPDYGSHYTGKNRVKITSCREERSIGSRIRKTECGPPRDDSARLRHMGTLDSIAGHARTSGGGGND